MIIEYLVAIAYDLLTKVLTRSNILIVTSILA